MALTLVFALLGALVFALFVVPVLCVHSLSAAATSNGKTRC